MNDLTDFTLPNMQPALDWLHAEYFAEELRTTRAKPGKKSASPPPAAAAPTVDGAPFMDDETVLKKARKARNGAKFAALYEGDTSGNGNDASSADLALCNLLAFYTRNPEQIDRLFRGSALFRDKWDRPLRKGGPTYGAETVSTALESVRETYGSSHRRYSPPPTEGPGEETNPDLPLIRLEAGFLHRNVEEGQAVLLSGGVPVYQRGAELVRPVVLDKPSVDKHAALQAGALILSPAAEAWLQIELTRHATLVKFDMRSKKWLRTNAPPWLAKAIIARAGDWAFPVLAGTLEAPTLSSEGRLIDQPGYDAASGLYLHLPPGFKLPALPASPDLSHAIEAKHVLLDLLKDFPFEDEPSRAVVLAAILTALVRRPLPTAPGFLFDAPTPGSGKSLLADIVAMIATGRPAAIFHQGQNDEETEKRLGSFLLQGHSVLNMDNIERPLSGELLCSLLTQTEVNVRPLGESRIVRTFTNLLFMATGNNLRVKGDLTRRVLVCRLDPATERPDQRHFDRDLYEYIPRHRSTLIAAALTILRAYQAAGRPSMELEPYGSFEAWSGWIRHAVVWIGMDDPCLTRTRLEGSDHVTGELSDVLSVWAKELPVGKHTIKELIEKCQAASYDGLKVAFLNVASNHKHGDRIDSRILSHWLRKHERRVVNGLRLVRAQRTGDKDVWGVESLR